MDKKTQKKYCLIKCNRIMAKEAAWNELFDTQSFNKAVTQHLHAVGFKFDKKTDSYYSLKFSLSQAENHVKSEWKSRGINSFAFLGYWYDEKTKLVESWI